MIKNHVTDLKGMAPYGYRKILKERFDLPYWKIGAVLDGRMRDKWGILEAAYEMALENKTKRARLNKLIKQLKS